MVLMGGSWSLRRRRRRGRRVGGSMLARRLVVGRLRRRWSCQVRLVGRESIDVRVVACGSFVGEVVSRVEL